MEAKQPTVRDRMRELLAGGGQTVQAICESLSISDDVVRVNIGRSEGLFFYGPRTQRVCDKGLAPRLVCMDPHWRPPAPKKRGRPAKVGGRSLGPVRKWPVPEVLPIVRMAPIGLVAAAIARRTPLELAWSTR